MEYVLWIFVILYPSLVHSESGDGDAETIEAVCSSLISLGSTNLTCEVDYGDFDSIQYVTLCRQGSGCLNGTLEIDRFSFYKLPSIFGGYELTMYLKDGVKNKQVFDLVKIVKIPTPLVHNVTLKSDMVIIQIQYNHDFVNKPVFQVEMWGASSTDKTRVEVIYQPVTIGAHTLKGNGIYHVRVRAKPEDYFDGIWTAWSPVMKFHVKGLTEKPPLVTYIILCIVFLVIGIILVVALRWKKEIQAYISPNIPNPKATLAHIHKEKERPPVSFSPEIFKDIIIARVDYAEEKQLTPEIEEGQEGTPGSCEQEDLGSRGSRNGDDTSRRLEEEMSHLKIKLLDQPEEDRNVVGCQSLASVQRDCRDETYVTMSSLYKTQ